MIIGLLLALAAILVLPFLVKRIEHNLEFFLFVMGILVVIISGEISPGLFLHIFHNEMLYFITGAVLVAGIIFKYSVEKIRSCVEFATRRCSLYVFLFLVIAVLGLLSSVITAIIASLVLVEIVQALPFERTYKIRLCVIACFSIGLGAALTPIGEPLATIVVSLLDEDFFFLFRTLGLYIIPGVLLLSLFGAVAVGRNVVLIHREEMDEEDPDCPMAPTVESFPSIVMRAAKIFLFIIALELLGAGFKPLINTYIIHLNSMLLYWINIISAVLDNATLAAAEISPMMTITQVKAILMGLLVSGGILIPGNIPNIISACKLEIGSKEWAKLGIPIGFAFLILYFVVLFFI